MTMIVLDGVTMRYPVVKGYRDYILRPLRKEYVVVVHEVSLTVLKGEAIGLLGPNGAGKTTLLRLMGGLLYPTKGRVTVCGHDTRAENQRARRRVGYVLNEERSHYWRLTGRQNLQFFGALDNIGGKHLRRRIAELLDLVGLGRAADIRVANYSCGMRQRLALARGLLPDPEVLIMDEPTKALDPVGAEELRELMSAEFRARKTLVLATHLLGEAERMCDRACVIVEGRITACDSVGRILEDGKDMGEFYKAHARSKEAEK